MGGWEDRWKRLRAGGEGDNRWWYGWMASLTQWTFVAAVQSLSRVWLFVTSWTAAHLASLSFTISRSLLKLMSMESVMPFNHLVLCRPLLLLPSVFPSIRVFSNELALCIRGPKYWSFSFNISPSSEYSGLISIRMDWVGSPCSPRDSQESSPTPQFKTINSLALSLLYSPTLTSIHDNGHGFEQTQGNSEGQGSLVCFSPWGRKESGMTARLNSNNEDGRWGGEGTSVLIPKKNKTTPLFFPFSAFLSSAFTVYCSVGKWRMRINSLLKEVLFS